MRETPAFPGSVKPARKGVYKRSIDGFDGLVFSYWDGKQWHVQASTAQIALDCPVSGYQVNRMAKLFTWKGLAEKP